MVRAALGEWITNTSALLRLIGMFVALLDNGQFRAEELGTKSNDFGTSGNCR